ncbi:MAG: hypothetical protein ACK45G_06100, partial [Bacteroidota bacterium]
LSLNDNSISIGADGSIAYCLEEEMKKFERNGMTFKSVVSVPGTELVRIFNGHTAETYFKENGKWYYVP